MNKERGSAEALLGGQDGVSESHACGFEPPFFPGDIYGLRAHSEISFGDRFNTEIYLVLLHVNVNYVVIYESVLSKYKRLIL